MSERTVEIGQRLWYQPGSRRDAHRACEVEVVSIGRVWVHLGQRDRMGELQTFGKMDRETWELDGGRYHSPGTCYLSKQAYEAETERNGTWAVLKRLVGEKWEPPAHLSIDSIRTLIAVCEGKAPSDEDRRMRVARALFEHEWDAKHGHTWEAEIKQADRLNYWLAAADAAIAAYP